MGTIRDVTREIRLRSLGRLFWLCTVALPLVAQAPPSADTFEQYHTNSELWLRHRLDRGVWNHYVLEV